MPEEVVSGYIYGYVTTRSGNTISARIDGDNNMEMKWVSKWQPLTGRMKQTFKEVKTEPKKERTGRYSKENFYRNDFGTPKNAYGDSPPEYVEFIRSYGKGWL